MRKYRNRIMIAFAAVVMSFAMMPMITAQVHATDGVEYIYRSWDSTNRKVVEEKRTADCVDYNSSMTNLNQGWWFVNGFHVVNDRVNVSGEVNIIIKDGSTLALADGIHVPAGSTLNIYNETGGENGHFYAVVDTNDYAAIGGNDGETGGNINIHSGKVTANAYNENKGDDAAGIGGGRNGNGGTVRIYGGTVTAKGANEDSNGGAGIGGGYKGNGGSTYIYGGKVGAAGGPDGAGIGGGDKASGGTVYIYGGSVTANGGEYAAGIGSGDADGDNINGGKVWIYGGNVTATGGIDAAGIGGGEGANGANVYVFNGKVTATAGQGGSSDGGAGIGSGDDDGHASTGNGFYIYGGEVYAKGGTDGAGIGGGDGCNGGSMYIFGGYTEATGGSCAAGIGSGDADGEGKNGGDITIVDAEVKATGGKNAAGIGGGEGASGGTIEIRGNKVTATGGTGGAGIGGGDGGDSGNIKIEHGRIFATGGDEAAGIGGGNQGSKANPGEISITGGQVTATGGTNYGAGIGGGDQQNSGTIYLRNCEVTATGGNEAAGIGGGDDGESSDITIKGSEVTANGGEEAAGIGGGSETGSCGDIKITDCNGTNKIVAKGGRLGAGVGGGYARYKDISGNITIKDSNIEATGGNAAAGIGSGYAQGMSSGAAIGSVNTTIEGGDVTAVGGYNGGSGIGGGDNVVSGKILIEGGTINATGGENGGAGIGSGGNVKNKSLTTVDIEINGGKVTAKPGKMEDGVRTYPGVAIGLGGHDFYSGEPSNSFFNGTINLNAGEIVAYRAETETDNPYDAYSVIGVATDDDLSEVTGNVNFNGAHVQMYTADPAKAVRATKIYIKEGADIHQQVDYKTGADGPVYTAMADDRVSTLTSTKKYYVEVKPCEHKDVTYVDKGDKHSISCKNCNYSVNEAHSYGEPTWTWAEDNSTASAESECACGHQETVTASISSRKSDDGQRKIYTAKATFGGKEYVDTKTVELDPVIVTISPSYNELTYTGKEQQLGTPGVVEGGTLKYALGTDETTAPEDSKYKDSVPMAKDAGTYYVWCKVFGDDDHKDSIAQSGTVKINKQTITDPAIPDKHYTGSNIKADVPENDIYEAIEDKGGTEIGEYEVVLKLKDTANYKWVDSDEATHTLKFRIVGGDTNIVTVSIDGWTYGETAKEPSVTATHGVENAVITYAKAKDGENSSEIPNDDEFTHITPEDAGIWWVKASVPAGEGYSAGEGTARFEIAKASPTVTPPIAKTLTYGEEAQDLVVNGDAKDGKMYYAVTEENTEPEDDAYTTDVPKRKDIGTYYVWYKVIGEANYKDYEPHSVTAKIIANKTELNAAIESAKDYYDHIKDNESYKGVADTLKGEIESAQEVNGDAKATQDSVNGAKSALIDAVENAKADVNEIDKADKEAKDRDDQKKAGLVEQFINALPEKAGLSDDKVVKAARAAYNKLTEDQKALIPAETLKKLTDAEKSVEDAYKAAEAKAKTVKTVTVNVKTVSAKAINTAVNKAGGSNKYVTKIVLGKKVKKISKGAFKSYKKVKTLEVKTKKLKKKSVKKSLKGSKITKVKVNVGKKKANKKYIKKYKKIFTKKNCGKKVKVK